MNKRFITSVLVLICVSFIVSQSYACVDDVPLALIASEYYQDVCVGCSVHFDGIGSSAEQTGSYDPDNGSPYGGGNGIDKYYWNFGEPNDPNWYGEEGDPNHTYDTAGIYTVALKVVDDDNTPSDWNGYCEVWVYKIDKVVKEGTTDEGPIYVCLNDTVDLEAIPYPNTAYYPVEETIWEIVEEPNDANASLNPNSGSLTTTLSGLDEAGDYVVAAKCGAGDVGDEIIVTVVGVGEIHIRYATSPESWEDVTEDPNLVVLKGTKYTFKAFPDPAGAIWPSDPNWSGVASGTGETIDVNFPSVGTYELTAKCCSADTGKTVEIEVVEPTVYQLGFGGDPNLYHTPDANNGWADGNSPITDPVYNSEIGDNNSVCVTRSSSGVSLTHVKLKVTEGLSYATIIKVDANGTEDWNESGDVSFTGTSTAETSLGITGSIISEVKVYSGNFQIQWQYKVPAGTNTWYATNTTSHTVYVTWDTPSPSGCSVTEQRIAWVCTEADGDTNLPDAADHIYLALRPKSYTDAERDGPTPIWTIHDGEESQCPGLAMYIDAHFQMLGLGSGEIRYCWAKADGTCTYDTTGVLHYQKRYFPITGHSSPTTHDDDASHERLQMMDATPVCNNYEATCYFNSTYYALVGTHDGRYTGPYNVVTSCFSTAWYYWNGSSWIACSEIPW